MIDNNNRLYDKLWEMQMKIKRDNEDFACVTCIEIKNKIELLIIELLEFNIKACGKARKISEERKANINLEFDI